MKKILSLIVVLLLVGLSFGENLIPDFSLKSEDGKIVKRDDLKGKPSVLIFWGINCHSCKRELPHINELYKKYKGKVNFYAVVVDSRDIDDIKETKKLWKFDIPVLISDRKIIYKYRVIGVPMILIVDKDLKPYKKMFGIQKNEVVERFIKNLL
jgi:thiol-disulfide isomerase/thioredoxin